MTGHPPSVPVPEGYQVGGWTVRHLLGSGAFASVYAARSNRAGEPRDVALKFLPTGTSTPRQLAHLRDMAEREAEVLGRLRAPRLIRMFDARTVDDPSHPELDGATVLVLEAADRSLDALLADTGTPDSGPALLAEVCEGLVQLHQAGWVHGDLKPANVLLMADGSVRLADFNIAAELEGTHAYAPAFGTLDYTPPELLWAPISERGRRIRPTTDIWAFGVLAHLVLTGVLPQPGGTPQARRDAVVRHGRGTEPLRMSPDLPDTWRQIVADCLAPTHEQRAAHDAAGLLARIRDAADLPAAVAKPRAGRRRRTFASLAAAAALAAAVFGVYTATHRSGGAPAVADSASPTVAGSVSPAPAASPNAGPSPLAYERCLPGSVCFFTEPDGQGQMCAWAGDDVDWATGPAKCTWASSILARSAFNNGRGSAEGDPLADVVYFGEPQLGNRMGCLPNGTKTNLPTTANPRSHVWTEHC